MRARILSMSMRSRALVVNKEVLTDEVLVDLGLKREVLVEKKQ